MVSLKGGSALGTSTWSRIGWFIAASTCLFGGNLQAPAPKAGAIKGRLELIQRSLFTFNGCPCITQNNFAQIGFLQPGMIEQKLQHACFVETVLDAQVNLYAG